MISAALSFCWMQRSPKPSLLRWMTMAVATVSTASASMA